MKPLRVLTEIRSTRKQRYAIVATFNGDLRFFERSVYRRLNAYHTLVLMDAGWYDQMMGGFTSGAGPRYAGIRYSVEPVYVKDGVFHPKFVLVLSDNRAHLLLGSGNLGESGYMRNAEVFTRLEASKIEGKPLDEAGRIVVELCSFLKHLVDAGMVLGEGAQFIDSAIAQWTGAELEGDLKASRSTWLLHSLTRPILDQVADRIGAQPVETIAIVSRYFGSDFALFDRVMDRFSCQDIHLYVQPKVSELPVERVWDWPGRVNVQLHELGFFTGDDRSRDLHAKLIIWKTQSGAYCLSGSPNFTQAALERSALPTQERVNEAGIGRAPLGNVEVAILQFSPQRDAFDYLLAPPLVQVRDTDWDSFQAAKPSALPMGSGRPRPLQLLAARYRGRRLTLCLAQAPTQSATLVEHEVWLHPIGQNPKRLLQPTISGDTISVKNVELDGAAAVWIQALDSASGDVVTSNRRWVAQEGLAHAGDTVFTVEDFEECKELGGIEGVLEALRRARERAEDPEWLLAFLRQWNIRAILEMGYKGEPKPPQIGVGKGGPPKLPPEKPNVKYLLDTGVRTLVGLGHREIIEEIRNDYVRMVQREMKATSVRDFRLGFRYYIVYNNLMALILHGLLQRTAQERDKLKRHQPTQYLHFANMTREYLSVYSSDWEKMLSQGDRTLGELQRRDGEAAEEMAAEFLVCAFLAHHIGRVICSAFRQEGHEVRSPPKMPDLKQVWQRRVTFNLREPTQRLKKLGELELVVRMAREHYEPALEALGLETSVASVTDQLSSLLQ